LCITAIAWVGAHGTGTHHGLRLAAVLEADACVTHHGGSGDMNTALVEGLSAHPRHTIAVGHDLCGVLLVLGVLDQLLVLACPSLSDAAEGKDDDREQNYATNDTADDVLGLLTEAVPFLLDALGW